MQMENISVKSWILTNLIRRNPSMVAWTSITTALRYVYLKKRLQFFSTQLCLCGRVLVATGPGRVYNILSLSSRKVHILALKRSFKELRNTAYFCVISMPILTES